MLCVFFRFPRDESNGDFARLQRASRAGPLSRLERQRRFAVPHTHSQTIRAAGPEPNFARSFLSPGGKKVAKKKVCVAEGHAQVGRLWIRGRRFVLEFGPATPWSDAVLPDGDDHVCRRQIFPGATSLLIVIGGSER